MCVFLFDVCVCVCVSVGSVQVQSLGSLVEFSQTPKMLLPNKFE